MPQNQAHIGRQAQAGTHANCEAQAQAYSIVLAVGTVHNNILLLAYSVLAVWVEHHFELFSCFLGGGGFRLWLALCWLYSLR